MFMLTLDSPEVLDHLYPKMTTKRATGQVESTYAPCSQLQPKKRIGGSESANALQAGSLHLHSFTHSLAPSSSPIHSTLQIARHIVSPRAKRNDSVRPKEVGREETREERAKCRQTMNDISPPSLLSSIPVFPFHLASLVTAIIALPAWGSPAGWPASSLRQSQPTITASVIQLRISLGSR